MNLDSRDRIHLNWMFENQPGLVRELLKQNKLLNHLDSKMQQEYAQVDRLKSKHGMSEREAFALVVETILAPASEPELISEEGDDLPMRKPEPIPESEQRAIF